MIDFIISKLGILIFAITMAGILLYFSSSVKDVFLADETVQISNIMAKQIKYMAESDNLCSSTKVILPKYIDIFGVSDSATFSSVYYNLNISKVEKPNVDGSMNHFVIFSVINKQTKKEIALESFMTKSDVTLYDQTTNNVVDTLSIDPTLKQVVYMVKSKSAEGTGAGEIEKTNIFFVNCNYDRSVTNTIDAFNDCYIQLKELKTKQSMSDYPFFCVPTSAPQPGIGGN